MGVGATVERLLAEYEWIKQELAKINQRLGDLEVGPIAKPPEPAVVEVPAKVEETVYWHHDREEPVEAEPVKAEPVEVETVEAEPVEEEPTQERKTTRRHK